MRKVINCECGEAVRCKIDEELIAAVQAHISLTTRTSLGGSYSRTF